MWGKFKNKKTVRSRRGYNGKDNQNRKSLGVYCTYQVDGLNLVNYINTLKNKGISLYNLTKTNAKSITFSIEIKDEQKFFAISKNMCYNYKKVKSFSGKGYPFFYLSKNIGLVIGCFLFIFLTFIFNDLVFEISFTGKGSVYKNQINSYLKNNGITTFTRFSQIDLNSLSDGILASNENLSFCECQKVGNRLIIETASKVKPTPVLSAQAPYLKTDFSGEIVELKVYRGTPLKKVGDKVEVGEIIVDGFVNIKEQTVKTNVIASAKIKVESEFYYYTDLDNQESVAESLALAQFDRETVEISTEKHLENEKYLYISTLYYIETIFSG